MFVFLARVACVEDELQCGSLGEKTEDIIAVDRVFLK
jgi:hypothetical protein